MQRQVLGNNSQLEIIQNQRRPMGIKVENNKLIFEEVSHKLVLLQTRIDKLEV